MGELGRELTNTAPNKKFQSSVYSLTKKVNGLFDRFETNKHKVINRTVKK